MRCLFAVAAADENISSVENAEISQIGAELGFTGEEVAAIARGDSVEDLRAAKARADEAARPAPTESQPEDEPDVGLSGAEGLAHP